MKNMDFPSMGFPRSLNGRVYLFDQFIRDQTLLSQGIQNEFIGLVHVDLALSAEQAKGKLREKQTLIDLATKSHEELGVVFGFANPLDEHLHGFHGGTP